MLDNLNTKKIILASQSPRRKELFSSFDIPFEVVVKSISESFPSKMNSYHIAEFLAQEKADVFNPKENELIITADTVVIHRNQILNKPKDLSEAKDMLSSLSNSLHEVVTGVCIYHKESKVSFSELTSVRFKKLDNSEIDFYINNYNPTDKAGAYGIQDWIGKIGIKSINGCYYNVMGLPLQTLYKYLRNL